MTRHFRTAATRHLITLAVAGLGLVLTPGTARAAFLDFTVDEVGAGVGSGFFIADKINGAYSERITFDGLGGFTTTAVADFGQYLRNEGTIDIPGTGGLGGTDLNTSYDMYAVLTASGTVTPIIPGILFGFTATSAAATMYLDPSNDTTFTLPAVGGGAPTFAGDAEDYSILSASALGSTGPTGFHGILAVGSGGFFDFSFTDPTLTPAGTLYWPDLPLFGLRAVVDGDFDNFGTAGNQIVTGDASVVFVPEPAIMSLLGIGLLGAGVAARRRRQSAR